MLTAIADHITQFMGSIFSESILDVFLMMLKPCRLSSRCSGSIIFILTEWTKKDTILRSFGTSKYEANCRKPSREHFRACARRSLVLWCLRAGSSQGGGDGVGVVSGARRLLAEAPN